MLFQEDIHLAPNAEDNQTYTREVLLMDALIHGISGVNIPSYIEEILANNYCPNFMRMSIVRDAEQYRFTYRKSNLKQLKINSLDMYSKLVLLKSIIEICMKTESYLIKPDSYLIEPELIYTTGKGYSSNEIRLMYYPDVKHLDAAHKIMLFAERIKGRSREERELFEQFRNVIETGDINRAGLFLDKNILRMEGRSAGLAG